MCLNLLVRLALLRAGRSSEAQADHGRARTGGARALTRVLVPPSDMPGQRRLGLVVVTPHPLRAAGASLVGAGFD